LPPAVIAGGVAAVGTIGGAIIGSSAQKKASSQANDTQQAATQAQLQLGQQSLAVQQQLAQQSLALQDKLAGQGLAANLGIYNSNYGMLSPFVSRGNVAGDAINALLGLPTAPVMTSPMANGIPSFPGVNAPATGAPAAPAPGTPAPGTPAPAAPMSLDDWYMGAVNAMLPNITQADNRAAIQSAATPEAKFNAAMAISPASSDQYGLYQQFASANPKPTAAAPAPAAPAPAATTQPVSQSPLPAAGGAPRLGSFVVNGNFDMDAYRASRGQAPAAATAAPVAPAPQTPAPQGAAPVPMNPATRPSLRDYQGNNAGYIDALRAWRSGGGAVGAPAAPGAAPAAPAATPQGSAFENFANSAGMQFQLEQGGNMIENSAAGRGALGSGATLKALQNYGQQTALNNYFMPYMSLLGGQQATGAQAGSAVAGVGSNFANTAANITGNQAAGAANINQNLGNAVTGINNGMGSAIGSGANAAAQNAYNNGAANAGMWGSIGGALGNFAGSFLPRY
jgi:hypothetical protein